MTGHLLGAAGAVEAIACIASISEGFVPPTINHFTDDPDIDNKLNLTFNTAQERKINTVISNTFGFGVFDCTIITSLQIRIWHKSYALSSDLYPYG